LARNKKDDEYLRYIVRKQLAIVTDIPCLIYPKPIEKDKMS